MSEINVKGMRKALAALITGRLEEEKDRLKAEFQQSGHINSCFIDNLLPVEQAMEIYQAFPSPEEMAIHRSIRENKRVAAQMNLYHPLLEEIVYAFQEPAVVALCTYITGIRDMEPDEHLYAGGISLMSQGNFLNPHLDNSHDNDRERYRVLNLLYYISPDWKLENGGNLELWDGGVQGDPRTIVSQFNRLVLMITNQSSYHSVSKVVADGKRCCVSNYYFSHLPADNESYFHVTSFYGRPEEAVKGMALSLDRKLRNFLRKITGKRLVTTKHIYKKDD
ncbi:2OG-Fe(II) oxygenase [Taibaiella koreensis]|uniref:2OG-Fe(II) oxygenase n=1 Tax=Taibaiella koreensis TaxID=1268548 RepID=UPI000E59C68D|nr:2OG-Fe(II) oxygenase [Taibaiella koreensis]